MFYTIRLIRLDHPVTPKSNCTPTLQMAPVASRPASPTAAAALDTACTPELLECLLRSVMVRRDGTPWVGSTPAQRVAAWRKILTDLQERKADVTFADLLRADVISALVHPGTAKTLTTSLQTSSPGTW